MRTSGAPDAATEPLNREQDLTAPEGAVGDSLSVALWTVVSRFTGVLRGIVIAAVLGATYFANTYQYTNSLPNLVFYGLLAGSMFSSLLVPALVRHVDPGDRLGGHGLRLPRRLERLPGLRHGRLRLRHGLR